MSFFTNWFKTHFIYFCTYLKRMLVPILASLLLVVSFQNCKKFSTNGSNQSPTSTKNNAGGYSGLRVDGASMTKPGQPVNYEIIGGQPPYSYKVVQGSGSFKEIDTNHVTYTPDINSTVVQILQFSDSGSLTVEKNLAIETNAFNAFFSRSSDEAAPGETVIFASQFHNISGNSDIACGAKSINGTLSFSNGSPPLTYGSYSVPGGQSLGILLPFVVPLDATCGSYIQASNYVHAQLISSIDGSPCGSSFGTNNLSVYVNCALTPKASDTVWVAQPDPSLQCNSTNVFTNEFTNILTQIAPGQVIRINLSLNNRGNSIADIPCPITAIRGQVSFSNPLMKPIDYGELGIPMNGAGQLFLKTTIPVDAECGSSITLTNTAQAEVVDNISGLSLETLKSSNQVSVKIVCP